MSTGVLERARTGFATSKLAKISASLVGTQAITSVLGLAFWTLAARRFSVPAVGLAGAAIALMMVLGSVGMLGLGTLLIAEMPKTPQAHRRLLVRTAVATASAASALLGLLAVGVISVGHIHSLASVATPFNGADFVVGTMLTGLTMVLDQAVLVIGNGNLQLERNTVASAVKVVALLALSAFSTAGMTIYLAWAIGNAVSLPVVLFRTRGGIALQARRQLVDVTAIRRFARSAGSHHVLNLVLQAPFQLLSVLVAVVLSTTANGYFSTARSITGFVYVLPFSITVGLFAASGGDEREVARRMRRTIPFGLVISLLADLVLFPFGHLVLEAFGAAYAAQALTILRVLVLAGLAFVIKDHYVALRRTQGRTTQAASVAVFGMVFEIAAAYVGALVGGTVGLCAFWVGALSIEALLLIRPLRTAMHDADAAPGGSGEPAVAAGPTAPAMSTEPAPPTVPAVSMAPTTSAEPTVPTGPAVSEPAASIESAEPAAQAAQLAP